MALIDIPDLNSDTLQIAPCDAENPTGLTNAIQFRQREAIRLGACGVPYARIAADLDWSYSAVTIFLTSPIAQMRMVALSEHRDIAAADISNTIQQLAPKCMEVINGIIDDETKDPKLRYKAASDMLDRAGHAAVKRNLNVEAPLGGSIIDLLKQRAIAAGVVISNSTTTAEPIEQTA